MVQKLGRPTGERAWRCMKIHYLLGGIYKLITQFGRMPNSSTYENEPKAPSLSGTEYRRQERQIVQIYVDVFANKNDLDKYQHFAVMPNDNQSASMSPASGERGAVAKSAQRGGPINGCNFIRRA